MNDLTEPEFTPDRNVSVTGLESDTIGGFNCEIDKQKEEPGKALHRALP